MPPFFVNSGLERTSIWHVTSAREVPFRLEASYTTRVYTQEAELLLWSPIGVDQGSRQYACIRSWPSQTSPLILCVFGTVSSSRAGTATTVELG
jgi:hypothetical protein